MAKHWISVAACVAALAHGRADAHHSEAVFDLEPRARIELRGVIVDFKLRSPHASFVVDARVLDADGDERGSAVARWEVEWEAAPMLQTLGVDAQTFTRGDPISIVAAPHRDPKFRFVKALAVYDAFGEEYVMANSNRLFSPTLRAAAAALSDEGDAPATPLPVATAGAGLSGRWQQPLLEFGQDGPNLPLNDAGMAAWRNYDRKSSPANTCEPISVPAVFLAPFFLFELRIDAERALLYNEAYELRRTVPLDGTTAAVDDGGWFGRARGRVESGTLIVESRDFRASKWGLGHEEAHGGADVPSSPQKTLVERFTALPDGRTLAYEYTLYDPVYMTQPYTARVELTRVPDDAEMYRYECDLESAAMWSRDATDPPLRVEEPR
jgi:hypothetical protein